MNDKKLERSVNDFLKDSLKDHASETEVMIGELIDKIDQLESEIDDLRDELEESAKANEELSRTIVDMSVESTR